MRTAFVLLAGASLAFAQSPVLSGVLNSGDYTSEVAPGAIVSIFGQNLATRTLEASQVPLPTSLDGTSVELVIGSRTLGLPLFFVSTGQINAQLPFEETGAAQIRVRTARGVSPAAPVQILDAAPKLFTWTRDGKGEAVMLHADYTAVNSSSPARAGETVIVYLTGLGAVTPPVSAGSRSGDGSASAPLNYVVNPPRVTVGGRRARVLFAGLAPYFAGLYQLNIQIPSASPTGLNSIVVTSGQGTAQVNVAVALRSSWTLETEASLGVAGGSLAGAAATVTFAPGALGATTELALYRDTDPKPVTADRFRASSVTTLAGVPEQLSAPVTLSVNLTKAVTAGTQLLMAVDTNSGAGDGIIYLDATVRDGKAEVTLPATGAARSGSKEPLVRFAGAGMRSAWSFWAIAGYYAYKSAQGHFRIIYPATDLIEGGAEQISEALEDAYTRIEKLGFSWARRNGTLSWPIDVSIDWFEDERRDRWGEEGSTAWGVQRQGINLNAHFMTRDRMDTMRTTSGHELFHLMQNLYDLEAAPSRWLWMEEAASTWLERRLSANPNHIPATVAATAGGTGSHGFFERHGLEYTPGDPDAVQDHGYGASLFLEYLTRRYGDGILARILTQMADRAPGLSAHPRYLPVQAIDAVTNNVGVDWQQFCENYMARGAYGTSPQFPTTDLIIGSKTTYRWSSSSDPGPTFEYDYPDLSARIFYVDLRGPQFAANTKMNISLAGGAAAASAIVYRTAASGEWTRLAVVRDTAYQIADAQALVTAGQRLAIMVVNARAVAPYSGRTRLTLRVSAGDDRLQWLQQTSAFFWTVRIRNCFRNTQNQESCTGDDFLVANRRAGVLTGNPPLVWNGTRFTVKGQLSVMHDVGGNFEIDLSGEMDPSGKTLKSARFLVKNRGSAGELLSDWDVEIADFPISTVNATSAWYEPYNVTDWSKRIIIHKKSTYAVINGSQTEIRKYSRTEAITSSWAIFGKP